MKHNIVIDIVGLEYSHLDSGIIPNISKIAQQGEAAQMEPVFPAVTCTVQASLLSGKYPQEHGIVANGLYDRDMKAVSFWEQPSALVQADRVWDQQNGKTAVLFWQNIMYASSDIVITPRPIHLDDRMVMWCYSKPAGYYEKMKESLGEFDISSYWGPLASPKSSDWIARAAEYTLENERPERMFVYIPHVDYSVQRFGKDASQVKDDLKKADDIVGRLIQKVSALGISEQTKFTILSEYSFNNVSGAVALNLVLRDAGLLSVREIHGKEYVDYEYSKAFAMVDHQIAHIFAQDGFVQQAKKVLEATEGVDRILDTEGKRQFKIDHKRSGDLIAISDQDKWFSYYWWHDESKAPDFARKVDIHRKPGYDPVELFFDPKTRSIPLDTRLVKGSHGRPPDAEAGKELALYVSNTKNDIIRSGVAKCTDIVKCFS